MAHYINKDTYVGDTGKQLKDIKTNQQIVDLIYPVGSIFLTVNKVNPGTFLGGTWEQYSGGYIYAAYSSIDKTSYTGWGTQSHALTKDEMPSHNHVIHGNTNIGSASGSGYWHLPTAIEGWAYGSYRDLYENSSGTNMNGGNQGHSHNIATCDVFCYKRIA